MDQARELRPTLISPRESAKNLSWFLLMEPIRLLDFRPLVLLGEDPAEETFTRE